MRKFFISQVSERGGSSEPDVIVANAAGDRHAYGKRGVRPPSTVIGMLLFAGSDFLPTRRFATSIATLLLLALAGDLVLLSALLLGPLGRLFGEAPESTASQSLRTYPRT